MNRFFINFMYSRSVIKYLIDYLLPSSQIPMIWNKQRGLQLIHNVINY